MTDTEIVEYLKTVKPALEETIFSIYCAGGCDNKLSLKFSLDIEKNTNQELGEHVYGGTLYDVVVAAMEANEQNETRRSLDSGATQVVGGGLSEFGHE